MSPRYSQMWRGAADKPATRNREASAHKLRLTPLTDGQLSPSPGGVPSAGICCRLRQRLSAGPAGAPGAGMADTSTSATTFVCVVLDASVEVADRRSVGPGRQSWSERPHDGQAWPTGRSSDRELRALGRRVTV